MNKTIKSNIKEHQDVIQKMFDFEDSIFEISKVMINALKRKKTIFWCGNGGSASDSQHLAGELIGRFNGDRRPLKSIALNSDSSVMTCIANDYGYNYLFSRQLEGLGSKGDILIGITTSGNSQNVVNAFISAKKIGMKTIGFLGRDGGKAKKLVEKYILIPSYSTARIQEMHILIGHILCELIEEGLDLK